MLVLLLNKKIVDKIISPWSVIYISNYYVVYAIYFTSKFKFSTQKIYYLYYFFYILKFVEICKNMPEKCLLLDCNYTVARKDC